MPKIKPTKSQELDNNFRAILREAMERKNLHYKMEIATLLHLSKKSGVNKFNKPSTLTFREIRILAEKLDIPIEKLGTAIR